MLIYGAVDAPVPGVNEPHYLGKAKHFWNPAWCAGDLLLESSNAHVVFYAVFGPWTQWLTLTQLAWLGRGVGYAVLAGGWWRAHAVLGFTRLQAWWSLAGFLAIQSWGNLSGEWMVGGIEGKVLSYGFLLLAFADSQTGRLIRAGLWAGLAVSFHPVAGGWAVLAAVLASLKGLRTRQRTWGTTLAAAGVMIVAAIPGMIPAVQLLTAQDSQAVRNNATWLQVYRRLAHHLDPMTFSWRSWICYGTLLLFIWLLRRPLATTSSGRLWLRIVCWAAVFALVGLLDGWGPRPAEFTPYYYHRMLLLKFYPFRLFDVMAPLTAAILATATMSQALSVCSLRTKKLAAVLAGCLLLAATTAGEMRKERLRKPTVFATPAWTDACLWIRTHTPASALFQTPDYNQNFKWFAQRAEYVSYKDMPQDNRSLMEWNRRMLFLTKWYRTHRGDGLYSNDELKALRAATGITHILTDRLGPFELSPCYTNDRFRVYDLTELGE